MFASNSIFFIGEPNRTTLRPICRRKMCRLTLLLKTWTAPNANNQAPSWTIGLCLGSGCFWNVIIVRKVERPSFYGKPLDMNMILPKIGRTRILQPCKDSRRESWTPSNPTSLQLWTVTKTEKSKNSFWKMAPLSNEMLLHSVTRSLLWWLSSLP